MEKILDVHSDVVPNVGGDLAVKFEQTIPQSFGLQLPRGVDAASTVRHALDHGIQGTGIVQHLADVAFRGGAVLMAAAALLALMLLLTPMRGLIGLAAGLGLLGAALMAGVVVGSNTQLSDATGGHLHLTLGTGLYICAVGFAVVAAGGAVAALRPLAGIFTALGLAVLGAVLGGGLALLVGGDHVLTGAPAPPLPTPTSPR